MGAARGIGLAIALIALERPSLACEPIALLAGPAEIVATLGEVLGARGVATEPAEGCPLVRARIGGSAGRWFVIVEDPHGRRAERTIAEIDVVATFIESWTRIDQEAPLLAARGWVPDARDAVDRETPPPPLAIQPSASHPLGAVAALESSLGGDGSSWFGISAGACVRLWGSCVGVTARYAYDAQLSGDSARLDTKRTAFDLIVAGDRPFRWRGARITAGAGIGLGWLRIGRMTSEGAADTDTGGARLDVHARIDIPLGRSLTLGVAASLGASPYAHATAYMDEGNPIAGEPRWFARLGLGLTYGAP